MNPLLRLRTPRSRHRDRADRVIDREYEVSRDTVLRVTSAKLRQIDVTPDPRDLEAAYNQAWHALYQRLAAGAEIENRTGFLVTITYRRAIDEHRVTRPERRLELPDDVPAAEADLVQQLDDRRRLRALRTGMRERLDDRELRAATLCYLHGYSRREAAEALGVSPRRMEKVMDRVSKRMSELAADVDDDWCEQQRSLIHAYALGVLDPDGARHPLAVAHLEDCAGCRRRVLMLRGLAAVAPPVPLLLVGGGSVGGGAASSGDRPEAGSAAGTATDGGRAGFATPAAAASVVVAVIGVTIGVVLLVDRDERPPTAAPVTAPAAPASTSSGAATAAARDRERAAAQRRERAARKRAERRRAERAQARRAAATAAATARDDASSAAAAPAAPSTAPSTGPAGVAPGTPSDATSGSSGSTSPSGSGPSSGASSGSSSGADATPSSDDASTVVVTDGAEEFDLGD